MKNTARKKILVIGSLNMDMVMRMEHLPQPGETILCDQMERVPGGKGANQAYAAARLGAETALLGAVGRDSYGAMQLESLHSAGVNTSHILQREAVSTGMAMISVDARGNNSIVVVPGANLTLLEQEIDADLQLIAESDIVILQLEIPLPAVLYAAKKAKELGKYVILDPAPVPQAFPAELLQYADIIKPNETELSMLTGVPHPQEDLYAATEQLKAQGAKNVIVTLGGDGVYLNLQDGSCTRIPVRRVIPVDTTAAEDSFTAALAVRLSQGENLPEAVRFANFTGSIVVTRKGAQSSIPSLEEVEQLMRMQI